MRLLVKGDQSFVAFQKDILSVNCKTLLEAELKMKTSLALLCLLFVTIGCKKHETSRVDAGSSCSIKLDESRFSNGVETGKPFRNVLTFSQGTVVYENGDAVEQSVPYSCSGNSIQWTSAATEFIATILSENEIQFLKEVLKKEDKS